jgi:hypothetical protein
VKTDGNQYNLSIYCIFSMTLLSYSVRSKKALVQDPGGEWVTLEIPFSNFVSDLGKKNTSVSYINGDLNRVKVEAVSFSIRSHNQKEGNFQVLVKSVEAIYRKEFEDLHLKYSLPVMFKNILKGGVDTGRTVLRFEKSEDKVKVW